MKREAAFTLAELLIALGILGVIATFTIPKVLVSQQNGKRVAVFRETVAAINAAGYQGIITGQLTTTNHGTYLMDHLNVIKICRNDAQAENCFPQNAPETSWEVNEPGVVFANGATVTGFSDGAGVQDGVVIDWNGSDVPNQGGDDQMFLEFCYANGCANSQKVGTLHSSPTFSDSETLFRQIFSN
jgi:prepilin-type N-terminal cleavage/methylation domain-containing protein